MSLLFVTTICDLYKDKDFSQLSETATWSEAWLDINFRLKNLKVLADSGINLIIFAEESVNLAGLDLPNTVTVVPYSLNHIETFTKIMGLNPQLPHSLNSPKDRLSYFALMNSKLDFIKLAKQQFPEYDTYCWIDCGIFKFVRDTKMVYTLLQDFENIHMARSFLTPCGYRPPLEKNQLIIDYVCWRFLGSLFLIKSASIESFKNACDQILHAVLNSNKITWEVNIWAILESHSPQLFDTYQADHNDSIFDVNVGRKVNAT